MKVVIFNAPPNAGKDIAASRCTKVLGSDHAEFKNQLFKLVKAVYMIEDATWRKLYTRTNKELPSELLEGRSPREALIHMSEHVIKPAFGEPYFGKATAKGLKKDTTFSDGGFVEEIKPIVELIGEDNLLIVRIHREGCNFDNDSRNYLKDGTCKNMVDIINHMPEDNNQKEYEDFLDRIEDLVRDFFDGELR